MICGQGNVMDTNRKKKDSTEFFLILRKSFLLGTDTAINSFIYITANVMSQTASMRSHSES